DPVHDRHRAALAAEGVADRNVDRARAAEGVEGVRLVIGHRDGKRVAARDLEGAVGGGTGGAVVPGDGGDVGGGLGAWLGVLKDGGGGGGALGARVRVGGHGEVVRGDLGRRRPHGGGALDCYHAAARVGDRGLDDGVEGQPVVRLEVGVRAGDIEPGAVG